MKLDSTCRTSLTWMTENLRRRILKAECLLQCRSVADATQSCTAGGQAYDTSAFCVDRRNNFLPNRQGVCIRRVFVEVVLFSFCLWNCGDRRATASAVVIDYYLAANIYTTEAVN